MNVRDAFHLTVHAAAGGCEALAVRLGVSAAILRNKANPNCTTNRPTLEETDRLLGITGDYRVLHALAQNHGHVCVRMDEGASASDMAVLEIISRVWTAHGEVGSEVNRALEDGRITVCELERIHDAVKRSERALESMVSRLRGMAEK